MDRRDVRSETVDSSSDAARRFSVSSLHKTGFAKRHPDGLSRAITRAGFITSIADLVTSVRKPRLTLHEHMVWPDDVEQWCRAAADKGVVFETGDRFSFDNKMLPDIRLGRAGHREAELVDAVRLLADALAEARGPVDLSVS